MFGGRSVRGKIVEGDIFPFRDYKDMGRRQRVDVVKSKDVLVLIDLVAREFAAQDAGKDIVAIISHGSSPFQSGSQVCSAAFFVEPRGAFAARQLGADVSRRNADIGPQHE